MLDIAKIRRDFPILQRKVNGKRLVYLDNAATSQKPLQVIEAISDYYMRYNANVHRGVHTLAEEATLAYEEARAKVAKFINAEPDEIIFTKNATEALNLVMYAYGMNSLKRGERIATTIAEHHSSFVPLQVLAKRKKAKFEIADVDYEGFIPEADFEKFRGAKIAGVVHASNVSGIINPIERIAREVHSGNGVLIVDGSQSVPHMKVDVKKLDADFLAFTGHKMLGPMGVGVLYGKRELLAKMEPFLYGGDMISEVHANRSEWANPPAKFEAGTPNVEGAIGLGAAIDYLNKLGMENVREHETEILECALARLSEIKDVSIIGAMDAKKKTGLVAFTLEGVHPHDLAQVLDSEGVAIRAGQHCAQPLHEKLGVGNSNRASFYVYNGKDDVDALCADLEKARKKFL